MTTPGKMLHHVPVDDPKPIIFPQLDAYNVLKSCLGCTIHFPDIPEICGVVTRQGKSRIPVIVCQSNQKSYSIREWFRYWSPGNITIDDLIVVEHNTSVGKLRKTMGPKSVQHIISVIGRECTISEFKCIQSYTKLSRDHCYRVLSDPNHPIPGHKDFTGIKDHFSLKWIGKGTTKACLYLRGMFNHVFNATHDFISGSYDPAFVLWYSFFGIIPIASIDLTRLSSLPPEESCYAWDICKNSELVNCLFPPNCMARAWAKSNSEILFEPRIPPQIVCDCRSKGRLSLTTLQRVVLETVPGAKDRFPAEASEFVFTGRLEGKTAPIQCSFNGNLFCVKKGKGAPHLESASLGNPSPASSAHPVSEFSAAMLYHHMGVLVPSCAIYYIHAELDGFIETSVLFVSEWLEGTHPKRAPTDTKKGLIADILNLHFDAMGTKNANLLVLDSSNNEKQYPVGTYRIDFGGALRYMSNGTLKNTKARAYYPSRDLKTIASGIKMGCNLKTKINRTAKSFQMAYPALATHSKFSTGLHRSYILFISQFDHLSYQDLFDQLLLIQEKSVIRTSLAWCKDNNVFDSQILDNIGIFKVRFTELRSHFSKLSEAELSKKIEYSRAAVSYVNSLKKKKHRKRWNYYGFEPLEEEVPVQGEEVPIEGEEVPHDEFEEEEQNRNEEDGNLSPLVDGDDVTEEWDYAPGYSQDDTYDPMDTVELPVDEVEDGSQFLASVSSPPSLTRSATDPVSLTLDNSAPTESNDDFGSVLTPKKYSKQKRYQNQRKKFSTPKGKYSKYKGKSYQPKLKNRSQSSRKASSSSSSTPTRGKSTTPKNGHHHLKIKETRYQ